MNRLLLISGAAFLLNAAQAQAVTIVPDFTTLGSVYQDLSNNFLYNTGGTNRTDVTTAFEANVFTAINYWQAAVTLPYTVGINFTLTSLASSEAVGDSRIITTDTNGRPATTAIRVDAGSVAFFVDPTPNDNSEFAIMQSSAQLGGSTVNIGRIGDATTSAAAGGYDLLSLLLHEIDHSIGFSSSQTRFTDAVPDGVTLTVPTSVSGLSSSFDVPIRGTHIDGNAGNGLFNNTSIAFPGFNSGQRALLTAVDVYGLCTIEGCSSNQLNTDPQLPVSTVPEPGSLLLLSTAGLGLLGFARRSRSRVA